MKKYIAWDVFHLSLILSLLRLYPELYRSSSLHNLEPLTREEILGPSSAYTQTNFHHNLNNRLHGYIHPKNFDDSIARTLFINDLNSLINRPNWESNPPQNNIFAYILNDQLPPSNVNQSVNNRTNASSDISGRNPTAEEEFSQGNGESDLTQEDMDLIEILWKQDIDLGISRDVYDGSWSADNQKNQDAIFKDSALKKKSENETVIETESFPNPWDGISYRIDSETGEHIILEASDNTTAPIQTFQEVPSDDFDISLEEALHFFENDMGMTAPESKSVKDEANNVTEVTYGQTVNSSAFQEPISAPTLNEYADAIPTNVVSTFPSAIERYNLSDSNLPLLEQLQDISNLALEARVFNATHPTNNWPLPHLVDNAYNLNENMTQMTLGASNMNYSDALLRNSTLPIPLEDNVNANDLIDEFLLSLMTNETGSNSPLPSLTEFNDIPDNFLQDNFTTDNDFLASLLNEDVMDLMDQNTSSTFPNRADKDAALAAQIQASNDSAVSCMGSENEWHDDAISYQRVEKNWNERGSDTSNGTSSTSSVSCSGVDNSLETDGASYREKKYSSDSTANGYSSDSGCDKSSYLNQRYNPSPTSLVGSSRRFDDFPTNSHQKSASGSTRPINSFLHNHTYPKDIFKEDDSNDAPFDRDKEDGDSKNFRKRMLRTAEERESYYSSRDEKRARELNLPLTTKEITSLPIDEFNERLTKYELTDEQLTLIRDIRRRGKNKIAAQNCRKRKMDQIFELQQTLEELEAERQKLSDEQSTITRRRELYLTKYEKLYKFIRDMGPNPGPPDPPGYFPNRNTRELRPLPEIPIINNSTRYNNHENSGESNGHGGARVKRRAHKKIIIVS